jgi:hypothetical protein
MVITSLDKYIDEFEIYDDYGDEPSSNNFTMDYTTFTPNPTSQAMSKIERLITGEDADSIGTMITKANSTQKTRGINTPSSVTGSTLVNNFNSTQSTAGKSLVTSASRTLTEADLLIDKRMTTMETVLFLTAKRMGINANNLTDNNRSTTNEATSSVNEDGCTK